MLFLRTTAKYQSIRDRITRKRLIKHSRDKSEYYEIG